MPLEPSGLSLSFRVRDEEPTSRSPILHARKVRNGVTRGALERVARCVALGVRCSGDLCAWHAWIAVAIRTVGLATSESMMVQFQVQRWA
jgi:hypothetical protein